VKIEDFVSKNFSNLAGTLGGVARSLEDNEILFDFSLEEIGGI